MFWHMQSYMSGYIRSFFSFSLRKYSLFFFKYSCTNIFHRRSLYTFYIKYRYLEHFLHMGPSYVSKFMRHIYWSAWRNHCLTTNPLVTQYESRINKVMNMKRIWRPLYEYTTTARTRQKMLVKHDWRALKLWACSMDFIVRVSYGHQFS